MRSPDGGGRPRLQPLYALTILCMLNHAAFGGSRVAVSLSAIALQASPATIGTVMAR